MYGLLVFWKGASILQATKENQTLVTENMTLKSINELYNDYIQKVWKDTYSVLGEAQKTEMRRCFVAGFISATSEMARLTHNSNTAVLLAVESVKHLAGANNDSVEAYKSWMTEATEFADQAEKEDSSR